MKVPAITSHGSALNSVRPETELIKHAHNGLVAPAEDSDALANAIRHLHTDRQLSVRFGANSKARIHSDFNIRDSASNTLTEFPEHVPQ